MDMPEALGPDNEGGEAGLGARPPHLPQPAPSDERGAPRPPLGGAEKASNPAWALGYPLDFLQEAAALFKAEFKPHCYGAFGMPKERDIANAMAGDWALWTRAKCQKGEPLEAFAICRRNRTSHRHEDFAGRWCRAYAGDIMVSAIAGSLEGKRRLLERLAELTCALWVLGHVENGELAGLMREMGFRHQMTKIAASSDLRALWLLTKTKGAWAPRGIEPLGKADIPALAILQEEFISQEERVAILQEAEAAARWADHYSSYNKRRSWSAFALRGFDALDPGFIEKPAEMSKAWKAANPERLGAVCSDTVAAHRFPIAMGVAARIPGSKQRIRLMRLAPDGGELTRHADITDPEAGTGPGQLCRLHIPIITSPECRFQGWGLDGQAHEAHFPLGSLCYLDTRKPHAARNAGERERIHLVIDTFAGGQLRAMIASSAAS